ncbi:MAG: helix-turn-helix domain-containing protein, partial [Alphaproteobacteria bacterium]
SYRHLSHEHREEIAVLRAAGHSNAGIAAALGRAPPTISREITRPASRTTTDIGESLKMNYRGSC